jgi:Flp pilus assembly protein TadB
MAQTKRKRRTKHRGNAAGIVEHRGRTSRPPSPEERKTQRKEAARAARSDRYSKPPTWTSAANRALITSVLFIAVLILVIRWPVQQAIALGGFMLLIYIPFSYYMDAFVYKRRQQRAGQRKGR